MQNVVNTYASGYLVSSGSATPVVSASGSPPPAPAKPPTPGVSGSTLAITVTYPYTFFVFGNLFNAYMGGSFANNQISLTAITVMNFE
jgi:hypothetical protein